MTGACSKPADNTYYTKRSCPYYDVKAMDFGIDKDTSTFKVEASASFDDNIAFVLSIQEKERESAPGRCTVQITDAEGNQLSNVDITETSDGFVPSTCQYDASGNLYILGTLSDLSCQVYELSAGSTSAKHCATVDLTGHTPTDLLILSDHFVVLTYVGVRVFSPDWKLERSSEIKGEISTHFFLSGGPDITVLSMDDGMNFFLNTVDAASGEVTVRSLSDDFSSIDKNLLSYHLSGSYASDAYHVFAINYTTGAFTELADWNRIDLPPSDTSMVDTLRVLSQEQMLIIRNSVDQKTSDTCYLLHHRDKDPNQDKPILTIGGYGAGSALIQAAVYQYNTSDSPYRFEIRDYSKKYPFGTGQEMIRAYTEILADMNSGKGDDIYTGSEFDYNQWGDSGMVMDLSSLFSTKGYEAEMYLPCVTETAKHNGKIYMVFPGFRFSGYFGYSDAIGDVSNLTIDKMNLLADKNGGKALFQGLYNQDYLAVNSLYYRLTDFISADGFQISRDELSQVILYAATNGTPSTGFDYSDVDRQYITGELLFAEESIASPDDYWRIDRVGDMPVTYYGVPSVRQAANLIEPVCVTAVSADTKAPDACLDFLRILLSDSMQERVAANCIPVLKTSYENQLDEAMFPSNSSDSSSSSTTPMSSESAASYRNAVDSLNSIYVVNVNLWYILYDEITSYFAGGKDLDSMRESLINRINVYLDEQNTSADGH